MKVQEEYVMERSPGEIKPADTFGLLASRNVGKLIFFLFKLPSLQLWQP